MRKNLLFLLAVVLMLTLVFSVFAASAGAAPNNKACWGQATKVFARMGEMGDHSSSFPTPREGLRNLARLLFDTGAIPDDTMQALGVFVATDLELTIEACGTDFD